MGRQIIFYMSKSIQTSFIDFLLERGFIFLDKNALLVNQAKSDNVTYVYLHKENYGNILMSKVAGIGIDALNGSIIQFRKTMIKEEEKTILQGRVWMEPQYYADDGTLMRKNELLLKDYQLLVRWIKKRVPFQKIKKGEYYVKGYVNDELKDLQEKGYVFR